MDGHKGSDVEPSNLPTGFQDAQIWSQFRPCRIQLAMFLYEIAEHFPKILGEGGLGQKPGEELFFLVLMMSEPRLGEITQYLARRLAHLLICPMLGDIRGQPLEGVTLL